MNYDERNWLGLHRTPEDPHNGFTWYRGNKYRLQQEVYGDPQRRSNHFQEGDEGLQKAQPLLSNIPSDLHPWTS